MSHWPSISVVVPAFEAAATIGAQVEAICAQDYAGHWDLTVIDDGSSDDTRTVANRAGASLGLRYQSHRFPARRGQNATRNHGVQTTVGDILVFTDGDDLVQPGWLTALATALAAADLVGGIIDDQILNHERTRRRRPPHPTDSLPLALGSIPYAVGTNLAIWRSVLTTLGGWDESIRAGTDVDLCIRAQHAGLSLATATGAVVAYRHPSTRRGLWAQNYRWGQADRRHAALKPPIPAATLPAARITAARLRRREDSFMRLAAYLTGRLNPITPRS